jgi:large subunit ribosomal protein L30
MALICALRIRGIRNIKPKQRHTLKLLGLYKVNNAIIVKDKQEIMQMLHVAKDYITYGPINEETVLSLIEKKYLRKKAKEKKAKEEIKNEARKILNDFISSNKNRFNYTFRLRPPTKGYKNIKLPYNASGDLGKRDEMDSLIKRMI